MTELRDQTLALLEARFDRHGDLTPFAVADTPGGLVFIEMPDCDVQAQRVFLKRHLPDIGATRVVVVNEIWAASASTPEDEALIADLLSRGRLQDAPERLLREELRLFTEGVDEPITAQGSTISRVDGARSLGTWSPLDLRLPRPSFRRYFPERGVTMLGAGLVLREAP